MPFKVMWESLVILVNPRYNTGYILGKRDGKQIPITLPISTNGLTKSTLKTALEDKLNDGGTYNAYFITIECDNKNHLVLWDEIYHFFEFGYFSLYNLYTAYSSEGESLTNNIRWYENLATGTRRYRLDEYNYSSYSSNLPTGFSAGDLVAIHSMRPGYEGILASGQVKNGSFNYRIYNTRDYTADDAYEAWLIYEVTEIQAQSFEETPRWERYNGSAWQQVAHWNYAANGGNGAGVSDVAGYTMTADGSLHLANNVLTTVNQAFQYRFRTEHFQLAKFTGLTRSANEEMLKDPDVGDKQDIISEEDIERDYNIIYKFVMEDWPAPGTDDVVAYNYHFPWDFTELGYHYPLSEIPTGQRVFGADIPGKGEYAFINKFVAPSDNAQNPGEEFECMAGAQNGYMLCVNSAQKRATIMSFRYDQLSCSGQQIYLVGNYCNPVSNSYEPQITADLEGTNDGITWTPIYRYKSGKIPYRPHNEGHWFQMALPIDRNYIRGYKYFRCRAEIDGSTQRSGYLLIDRLRFIERSRGFSVFQNKATCIKEDSVTALIRINYQASPELYQPGKLIAYQFQKWDESANGGEGGYVPLEASRNNGNGTYTAYGLESSNLEIYPGYIKDGFTATEGVEQPSLKSTMGNDYGYVLIPETTYDPSASGSDAGQSALRGALIDQALAKLGITGAAATTRKANFLNETGNVRTFDQVVAHDYSDFVTVSFGGVKTPHIKSFVNVDGTWLLYIVCRLPVSVTDNNTFRIGMAVMNDLNDTPTFTEEACATFRILNVKHTTGLLVDGAEWPNYSRAEIEADPGKDLLPANETYRASIKLTVKDMVGTYLTSNPRCKFDLLHADADVRGNDAAFLTKYGCSRTQFVDDMEAFRIDDDRNVLRDVTDWHDVTPEMFTYTGRTPEVANAIYNRLNHLINDLHVLEIGLDYRDIYMGDRADSWFYLLPIPATGLFDVNRSLSSLPDTTMKASVCNDTLWLELHSLAPTAKLRFGYDSRVGDTYVIPVIRATRSDANGEDSKHLNVRVAESWTGNDAEKIILGWDAMQLFDSNDPAWTGSQTFIYRQDIDMRGHKPSEFSYYGKDDVIHFTPQPSGNNITLNAGYWYQFKTPFYAALKSETYESDPITPTGHSQFILSIAPDTVRWTPTHTNNANYWNDDDNWMPVVNGVDAPEALTKVPMGDTRVIIPQVAEGQLPIVADLVVEQMDTLHYGYAKNTCKEILFKPRSQMLGQELLEYKKAFVDVLFSSASWQTFSPALEHIYSGDMYIPSAYNGNAATAASTDTHDFDNQLFPKDGDYVGTYNPRVWPYAFYQGFYNSSVPVAFYNTDLDGTPVYTNTATSTSSVDWVQTNSLDRPYYPGAACIVSGYGMGADGEELIVRLPKKESAYHGFGKIDGQYKAGPAVPVSRPAYASLEHNLAFDKFTLGSSDGIEYTLHNETPSQIFFFGNPTMSLIDVYTLCVDNASVLQHEEGTYYFTAYQLIDDDNYTVKPISGPGQYLIAPQRAVGLIAADAANNLTVKLKPGALVAITGEGTIVNNEAVKGGSSIRRKMPASAANEERWLYIAAATETTDDWNDVSTSKAYLTLGERENAHKGFVRGEDAINIASGQNYYSDYSFSTPLSIYSIADNEALMLDMRDTLRGVPVVFSMLDDKYTFSESTILSFATSGTWHEPLYLHDALTGDSVQIRDGLQIAVPTPLNNQLRYFINGSRQTNGGNVPTDVESFREQSEDNSENDNGLTYIYDVLGRRLMTVGQYELLSDIELPTGVYIIQCGNKTGRKVIR